ncbi:hypothetical protein P5W04_07815 [Mycobacteroides abscessus subsp. abscessus]|nr:hypothetical protein [Mycobacteroides abscessus subsp. abscessus]
MTTPQTPTETTEPTEDTAEATDVDTTPDDTEAEPEAPESPNAEAAKWRTKLRAAEAERDQLRDQLTAQQRAVIDWRSSTAQHGAVDPSSSTPPASTPPTRRQRAPRYDPGRPVHRQIPLPLSVCVHRMAQPNLQQGNRSAAPAQQGLVGMFRQDQQTPGRR